MTYSEFDNLKIGQLVVYTLKGIKHNSKTEGLVLEVCERIKPENKFRAEYNYICKQPGFDEGFRIKITTPQIIKFYEEKA